MGLKSVLDWGGEDNWGITRYFSHSCSILFNPVGRATLFCKNDYLVGYFLRFAEDILLAGVAAEFQVFWQLQLQLQLVIKALPFVTKFEAMGAPPSRTLIMNRRSVAHHFLDAGKRKKK